MNALSLRNRLLGAGAVAVILALGLAAVGLAQLFGTHVERRAMAELSVHLDQVLAGLSLDEGVLTLGNPPADPRFARPYGGLYWQIETQEGVLRSRSLWDFALEFPGSAPPDGGARESRLSGPGETALLALERVVTLSASRGGGMARVVVASDTAELAVARRDFMADMAPYLALLAAGLIVAQWIQVTVGLMPLRRIGVRVSALRGDRELRMGPDWPNEVQPLATELDALLSVREADVDEARARAGDMAHGLKTPLQALMGEAARLRDKGDTTAAVGIEEVVGVMRAHVDRELARTRTAARARAARADARDVAQRVLGVLRRTPDGDRLDWVLDIPEGMFVAIDHADLAEALGAVAENAARHADRRVTLGTSIENGMIVLSVADDGPGMPQSVLAAMTLRGVRADESGLGAGLGLSIASEIAQAVGGELSLRNATPGLVVSLRLPRA